MEYIKMDPMYKKLWVNALRSGEYRQGSGHLKKLKHKADKTEIQHCCFGVLCEVLAKELPESALTFGISIFNSEIRIVDIYGHDSAGMISNQMTYFLKLHQKVHNAPVNAPVGADTDVAAYWFTDVNDKALMDFNAIADWIDTNL